MLVRRSTALLGLGFAALLLSGCLWVKPGSIALTQPGGIGPVALRFEVCSFTLQESEGKIVGANCGTSTEPSQGQFLLALIVPTGTSAPQTLALTPASPAAPATVLSRNAEVAAAFANRPGVEPVPIVVPAGFEAVGYRSPVLADPATETLNWNVEAGLTPAPAPDGGSGGAPLRATVLPGWRSVNAELPATRPVSCEEGPETICAVPEPELERELGTSDLKVAARGVARATPATQVKALFTLDFASSATTLPKFALTAGSNLPGAKLAVSSPSFSRKPQGGATRRAPATTRKVAVTVPANARPGAYEVTLTATAAQGGAVTGAAKLIVKPPLRPRLLVPRRVRARVASRKGVPVRVVMPVPGARANVRLLAPRGHGLGRRLLAKRSARARKAGPLKLRLRVRRGRALALAAAGARLAVRATIATPGAKPRRLSRVVFLR